MAHYAYVNDDNIVTSVIVGPDEGTEPDGVISWEDYFSAKGKGRAVRTSYNTIGGVHYDSETGEPSADQSKALRFNYAAINYYYDEARDAFIPPKPFDSWVLDEATYLWTAPVTYPDDGRDYVWNENARDWEVALIHES